MRFVTIWGCFIAVLPEALNALVWAQKSIAPKILKIQLQFIVLWFIFPKLCLELLYNDPIEFFWPLFSTITPTSNHLLVALSTLLMTYGIYFTARRMMGLRFLNLQPHVGSAPKFNFINDFRSILDELGQATSLYELRYITQRFFSEAFDIEPTSVDLIIRPENHGAEKSHGDKASPAIAIEQDLALGERSALVGALSEGPAVVRDELEFSAFYEPTAIRRDAIALLHAVSADIIVPIIDGRKEVLATITVAHNARPNKLFGISDYYEMQVYARYLATIIHLLQTRSLEQVLIHEKELSEELYLKHQEIHQYKESIRSFIGESHQAVGIILYKGKEWIIANKVAEEITAHTDFDKHEGLPITKALRALVKNVQQYKSPHSEETISPDGERIIARAVYSDGVVIIVLQRIDIATMLTDHMRLLKDPSQWDYLLYLETTQAGRMISELIPGKSPTLLNTKLTLLKAALSTRPVLISMPHDDLVPTVEIIHHISLRKKLYTLDAHTPEKGTEYYVRLFGINHIMSEGDAEGLLEKAHETGTIHIDCIENLSLDTQTRLYEFIRSGSFRPYRGSTTILSSARIICSTRKDLSLCVSEGTFSPLLYQELSKNSVMLPSIMALPEQEIIAAIADVAKNVPLSDRDKEKYISTHRPVSLHELRQRIHAIANHHTPYPSAATDPEHQSLQPATGDPMVIAAVKLGKQALRDQALMTLLWNKFQNQTRIATLLGVNRSSVNRRCREYGLISE